MDHSSGQGYRAHIWGWGGTGCEINGDLLDWPGTCETSFLRDGNLEEAAEDNRWWGSYGLSRVLPEDRDFSLPNPFPSEGH